MMKHKWINWALTVMLMVALGSLSGAGDARAQKPLESPASGKVDIILADGQFVFGPNVGSFDTDKFLRSLNSPLLPHATILEDKASYYSINPRVVLTILEIQSGSVTGKSKSVDLEHVVGYEDVTGHNEQLEMLIKDMVRYFYARLYNKLSLTDDQLILNLSTGEQVQLEANTNAGTLAILAVLAPLSSEAQWQDLISAEDKHGFVQTWLRLFPESDPLDNSNQIVSPAAPPADLLKLPFACGDNWSFSGGPHEWDGCNGGDPRSAVDFAPGVAGCAIPPDRWITSPADGTVSQVSCGGCQVYINHSGGWGTRFYHVANAQVGAGQPVGKDQHIGNPSCKPAQGGPCGGCPGDATGTHVHYDLMYNGAFYAMEGAALEGWIVHGTSCYNGYLRDFRLGDKRIRFDAFVF
jgi:LasA protease